MAEPQAGRDVELDEIDPGVDGGRQSGIVFSGATAAAPGGRSRCRSPDARRRFTCGGSRRSRSRVTSLLA
jgi:hypothetical protein